jgi:hypothetical protein
MHFQGDDDGVGRAYESVLCDHVHHFFEH